MAKLITQAEAARRLGVHPNTIRNWIKAELLTAKTMPGPSGFRRVIAAEVDALLAERRRATLRCADCGKMTTKIEAMQRRFRTGYCGHCGGKLV